MPRFEPDPPASGPVVRGYSSGGFAVDGGIYRGLILTPLAVREWDPPALAALQVEHLEAILALTPVPEFLILGTGAAMAFAPRALIRALDERGIGLEAMDSRAAARTWGMLRAEERWIVAAIMPL